jgi:cobalt-zinc-cadmium efflux system membrane fusion protein
MIIDPNAGLLPRFRHHRLWLAGGCAIILVGAGVWALNSGPGNAVARSEMAARATDDALRPSETQWESLKLAAVRQVAFRDEQATDGKIAINEDTTTPVSSPYSGRVTRLIAKPGDLVESGAPLFAIEASEFVQGHHDLVAVMAALEKRTRGLR